MLTSFSNTASARACNLVRENPPATTILMNLIRPEIKSLSSHFECERSGHFAVSNLVFRGITKNPAKEQSSN